MLVGVRVLVLFGTPKRKGMWQMSPVQMKQLTSYGRCVFVSYLNLLMRSCHIFAREYRKLGLAEREWLTCCGTLEDVGRINTSKGLARRLCAAPSNANAHAISFCQKACSYLHLTCPMLSISGQGLKSPEFKLSARSHSPTYLHGSG